MSIRAPISHEPRATWRSLQEYLDRPELLQPPDELIPGLAWSGRVTLLAGREKLGKSSVASDGVAGFTQRADKNIVLWLNLEESPFEVVERFKQAGAIPDRVVIAESIPNKAEDLRQAIEDHDPKIVVIDTLGAWGVDRVRDWNSSAQATPLILELVELARQYNVAIIIIHHGKKSDGGYRDSSAIGAYVDVIVEMKPDPKDEFLRLFQPKGRWHIEPFTMRWAGGRYEYLDGDLPLEERVYQFILSNPGPSKRGARENVVGKSSLIDAALDHLVEMDRVEDRGDETRSQYFVVDHQSGGASAGHNKDTPADMTPTPSEASPGHSKDTGQGTPPVPHPLKGGVGARSVEVALEGYPMKCLLSPGGRDQREECRSREEME